MELQRSIYSKLLEWKSRSSGSTALLIEGARRIGKSTIAKKFGQENYKSFALVDFALASKTIKDNFSENLLDLDRFFQTISIEYGVKLYERESLIIFDEVQMFPQARQAIKYLVADGRYDYLETGSLISIHENVKNIVIPSEEEKLKMHPLTFPEFLLAAQEEQLLDYIRECYKQKQPLIDRFHKRATHLVREYMLVGGMPQSVVAYFEGNLDFEAADRAKRQILGLYREDINKIAQQYRSKVSALFEYIPGYLSTHDKKIVLSKIDDNGEFNRYDDPLFWLEDSMMCNLCFKSTNPNTGLALTLDDSSVKCYMADTGLLVSLAFSENEISSQELYRKILAGNLSLSEGMLHENLIAQATVASGRKLFFYTHYSEEKHRNDIEVDFLLSSGGVTNFKIDPVEVKSSTNYTTSSYDSFKKRFNKRVGQSYIVHPKAFAQTEAGLRIPSYMWFSVLESQ